MSYLPGNEAQNRLDRSLALPAAPATSRLTLAALAQFLAALRKTDHRSRTITVEDTVSMRSCAISYRAAQVRSSNGSHRRRRGDPESLGLRTISRNMAVQHDLPARTMGTWPTIEPR